MVRFSYGLAPIHPAGEVVELIKAAEAFGFHGCYLGDDLTLQDPWVLCGAAARETERIRLGFSVTPAGLREPTLVAQALATLDDLSGGRVDTAIGLGSPETLAGHGIDRRDRPLARLREAFEVIRTLLADGELTYEGEFFRYSGLSTSARPVQERIPLSVGAMVGPRSFRLAGEIADGVHAAGCSRAYSEFVIEQVSAGAQRAGRDPRELDIGSWCVTAVSEDSGAAKRAARAIVAGWLGSLPRKLLVRHGLDEDVIDPVVEAMAAGDVEGALQRTPIELVEALALAGTPEECVEKIHDELVEPGIDHVMMGITDPDLVEGVSGTRLERLPDVVGQLRLIHDRIFPAFSDDG